MKTKIETDKKAAVVIKPESLTQPGEIGAVLELVLKDKNGRTRECRIMKSECFVVQFLQILFMRFQWLGNFSSLTLFHTVDGDMTGFKGNIAGSMRADAAVNVGTYGILVGLGNAPVTLNDYALDDPIAHGTGANGLQYGGMTFGAPTNDGTTSQFTLTRNFANGSGGNVVVNEVGLAVRNEFNTHAPPDFLILRDVITPITVPNGETLTVNYRIQVAI